MRFSHPSFLGITALIATSFLSGANSAPTDGGSVTLCHDSVSSTKIALSSHDMNDVIFENKLNKRNKNQKDKTKKKSNTNKIKTNKKIKTKITKPNKSNKSKSSSNFSNKRTTSKKKEAFEYSGDGTYFNPALGSCGITSKATDLIAALNAPQINNGENPNNNPICGKKANVKGPKGTVTVTIVDTCPPCKSGDLDLSPSAFGKIADYVDGRVNIEWSWA